MFKTKAKHGITSNSQRQPCMTIFKWACLTMEYHCRSGRKAPDQDEFNIR